MIYTRNVSGKMLLDEKYDPRASIPPCQLPVEKTVIELMLFLLRPENTCASKLSIKDASWLVSTAVTEHWIQFNIFTKTVSSLLHLCNTLSKV